MNTEEMALIIDELGIEDCHDGDITDLISIVVGAREQ